jgi:hypothetical protein
VSWSACTQVVAPSISIHGSRRRLSGSRSTATWIERLNTRALVVSTSRGDGTLPYGQLMRYTLSDARGAPSAPGRVESFSSDNSIDNGSDDRSTR